MDIEPGPIPESVTAHVALTIAGTRLEADFAVPTAPVRLSELVPLFHLLADAVVGATVKSVEARGRSISCRSGCAACCRQLVPLPEAEARRVRLNEPCGLEPRRLPLRERNPSLHLVA